MKGTEKKIGDGLRVQQRGHQRVWVELLTESGSDMGKGKQVLRGAVHTLGKQVGGEGKEGCV